MLSVQWKGQGETIALNSDGRKLKRKRKRYKTNSNTSLDANWIELKMRSSTEIERFYFVTKT